jgi:glutaconate CoA-transferase subunit A
MRDACLASRHVIITTEEIVASDTILSDPNRVLIPGFRVSAVVHAPWGAHPSPVPGYYNRDHQAFIDYRNNSKTPELYTKWKKHWVESINGSVDYISLLGRERMQELSIQNHDYSEMVDFGY